MKAKESRYGFVECGLKLIIYLSNSNVSMIAMQTAGTSMKPWTLSLISFSSRSAFRKRDLIRLWSIFLGLLGAFGLWFGVLVPVDRRAYFRRLKIWATRVSGAKAPSCSSWDTGRVAPFVATVTHRQNIFRSVTQTECLQKCYS